ncbi:MAG: 1-acyl-sn-glycerol-3-phosphate acyltransferase [Sandaracinaceae bacterium]
MHAVQVRMPEPPLLLADRCTGMDAEPGSNQKGICWTETDVESDSWYLHDGRMPSGIMIESGQADLFLISYLGADFLNRGERAYRLLGCEMTWLGDLPAIGETLAYDIHVDGHAAQGDVRLFFFHYDCHLRLADGTTRPALQVRGGQAGFFTEKELADSAGILWRPETQEIRKDARVDAPQLPLARQTFDREHLEAFAAGRPWDCFGDAFVGAAAHTRTPRIQAGRMLFLERVELDPKGGPWGRGYLRGVTAIHPDDWYFEGHFKNDPCMPGTLMLEGCVQAMAFYLAAMGVTVPRDGWRFAPIPNETYSLRCRGQVTPKSRTLTYEVFVEELHDGPVPVLYADLLCTVDGLGAFHARRFGLQLTPGWPLDSLELDALRFDGESESLGAQLARLKDDPRAATASYRGSAPHRFDYASLLACAWGKPSTAFGPMYERFDGTRKTPRLPGPPYHFVTRVTEVGAEMGELASGGTFRFEYEVPKDAWYFAANGARVMPFAVLLEAVLQPCGWTASYLGSTLTSESDFLFRNLDGKGTIHAEVTPESGTLSTTVKVTNVSKSSGMIIESFQVEARCGDTLIYTLDTVFGFFPPSAFVDQPGLPTSPEVRTHFDREPNVAIDLRDAPARFFDGSLRLAAPALRMIDRLSVIDPRGGKKGLGFARAEKLVAPGEWFFKSHFYQDPVQPGSLGIEAMLQLLQAFMIEAGHADAFAAPRFEAIETEAPHVWKYRGQVVPSNQVVTTTLEITEVRSDDRGVVARGDCSLWVDGKRIYEAHGLGMRVRDDADPGVPSAAGGEEELDPSVDAWLHDHCPTYTRPALPMMSMLDRMVGAVRRARGLGSESSIGLSDLKAERWVVVDGPTRLRTVVDGDEVRLEVWRDAPNARLSRFEVAARARIATPELAPMPPLELSDGTAVDPYTEGGLFHGPAFHYVRSLVMGRGGSRAVLDAGAGAVPRGEAHQGLLDALTHGIPHERLQLWSDRLGDDVVAYPHRLDVVLHAPLPDRGEVEVESCFAGFEGDDPRFPVARVRASEGGRPLVDLRLVEVTMPKGPLGVAAPGDRRRFLSERRAVPGMALSRREGEVTVLRTADVARSDWFPGTLRAVYGVDDPIEIAVREHLAAARGEHPSAIGLRSYGATEGLAYSEHVPLRSVPVSIASDADEVRVRDAGPSARDLTPVVAFWRDELKTGGPWPVEDLFLSLIERFVRDVHVVDPLGLEAIRGRPALFLGNHQVGIESVLFAMIASALTHVRTRTLAKQEHAESWLGRLIRRSFAYPGIVDPGVIAFFDRNDPASLPALAKGLAAPTETRSLMVHVEGTRAHEARHRVSKMSGIFIDLALEIGAPIVPVRFSGGLPLAPVADKLEFPVGYGAQDYWLGSPIRAAELQRLPYKQRIERVIDAINSLGPTPEDETPHPPDPAFGARVDARAGGSGQREPYAAIAEAFIEASSLRADLSPALAAALDVAPSERRLPATDEGAWASSMAALLARDGDA